MSMENLRQGATNLNNGGGKGKGSKRSVYGARWRPPQMHDAFKRFLAAPPNEESIIQVAEPVVFIKGEYPDFFSVDPQTKMPRNPPLVTDGHHFRVHTFAVWNKKYGRQTYQDIVCSAGPDPHAPQPCLGCQQVDAGKKDSRAKDQWALNVAHLCWYHTLPLHDKVSGQMVMRKDNSGPVMIKDECQRQKMENMILSRGAQIPDNQKKFRDCEACQKAAPFAFGDHRVLQAGFKHLKSIFAIDDELAKKCVNCGTNILRLYFNCGFEDCNARLVEIATTGWTNDQADEFGRNQQHCPHCNRQSQPFSEMKCGYDQNFVPLQYGGCPAGTESKPMSIYDSVLWLQREGLNTESDIVVKKVEPINNYRTHDGRHLSEHLKEIVRAPFDLGDMYGPETVDEQAKLLSIPNPFAQQTQQFQGYPGQAPQQPQQYGGQPQGNYGPPQGPQGYPPGQPQQGGYPQQQAPQYPNTPAPGRPDYGKY